MKTFEKVINGSDSVIKRFGSFQSKEQAPWIVCADGAKLSVQASDTHYCLPRTNYGPYTHVEVGYPTIEPNESWAEFFDGDWESGDRCGSVYGYVPVELVASYITAHGGEKETA